MGIFDEYLYKYGLHDSMLYGINIKNNTLIFQFDTGIYLLDEGKEMKNTTTCLMCIELPDLNIDKMDEHIEITKFVKKKIIYDFAYNDFVKEVKKNGFEIFRNYYSSFMQGILIEGFIMEEKYQILVSDIKNIKYIF